MAVVRYISDNHSDVVGVDTFDPIMIAGDGTTQYVARVDGTDYWYKAGWLYSDLSFAESNDKTTFTANLSTLPINKDIGSDFQIIAVNEFTSIPDKVDSWKTKLNYFVHTEPLYTNVFIDVTSFDSDESLEGVAVSSQILKPPGYIGRMLYAGQIAVRLNKQTKKTDENGYLVLQLAANTNIQPADSVWQIKVGSGDSENYIIPDDAFIDLADLTPEA